MIVDLLLKHGLIHESVVPLTPIAYPMKDEEQLDGEWRLES